MLGSLFKWIRPSASDGQGLEERADPSSLASNYMSPTGLLKDDHPSSPLHHRFSSPYYRDELDLLGPSPRAVSRLKSGQRAHHSPPDIQPSSSQPKRSKELQIHEPSSSRAYSMHGQKVPRNNRGRFRAVTQEHEQDDVPFTVAPSRWIKSEIREKPESTADAKILSKVAEKGKGKQLEAGSLRIRKSQGHEAIAIPIFAESESMAVQESDQMSIQKSAKRPRPPSPELPEIITPRIHKTEPLVNFAASRVVAPLSSVQSKSSQNATLHQAPSGPTDLKSENRKEVLDKQHTAFPIEAQCTSLEQLKDIEMGQKPQYAWWVLIRAAILGAKEKRMRIEDICVSIAHKYSYYESLRTTGAMQKQIRAAIGSRPCFHNYKLANGSVWYKVDEAVNPLVTRYKKNGRTAGGDLSLTASACASNHGIEKSEDMASSSLSASKKLGKSEDRTSYRRPLAALPPSDHEVFATSLRQLKPWTSDANSEDKMPYQTFTLARAAILGSPRRRMRLDAILQDVLWKYPHLASEETETIFKNTLSHAMFRHKCFFRVRDGSAGSNLWMVDVALDPRATHKQPYKKRKLKDKEMPETAMARLADPDRSPLDVMERECEAHLAYYAKQDDSITVMFRLAARQHSLTLSIYGPIRARSSPLKSSAAKSALQPSLGPAKSLSPQMKPARSPSLELPISLPSPGKASKIKTSIITRVYKVSPGLAYSPKASIQEESEEEIPPSSPGSLDFAHASAPSSHCTSSLEGAETDFAEAIIKSASYIGVDPDIHQETSKEQLNIRPYDVVPPVQSYVCGSIDFKSGIMCEQRFLTNDDRTRHLRYAHGKIEDKYLIPRVPAMPLKGKLEKVAKKKSTAKGRALQKSQAKRLIRQQSIEL